MELARLSVGFTLRGFGLVTYSRRFQEKGIICDLEAINVDKDAEYRVFRVGDKRNLFRVKHELMFPDSEYQRIIICKFPLGSNRVVV